MPASQSGMAHGGLQAPAGSPPSQMGTQQLPGASPQPTPGFEEALNNVFETLLQGNEADAMLFGQKLGQIQELVQRHQAGGEQTQGQGQGQPMAQPMPGAIPSTP